MIPYLLEGLLFFGGLICLYFGAEWVVRGGTRLAASFGVSPIIVGLTVVSVGTSAPELVVAVTASLRDAGELAVGNVLGSNLANMGLVLGAAAVVRPIRVSAGAVRREIPLMVIITVLLFPVVWDLRIARFEGGLLLAALVLYLGSLFWSDPGEAVEPAEELGDEVEEAGEARIQAKYFLLILVGLVALAAGAHATVESAVFFAIRFGVPELIIGLTVVALGTSLPELATSVVASIREEADIAVGNIIGSNIFNLTGILGSAALVRPLEIPASVPGFDLPVVLFFSVLLLPITWAGFLLGRWKGGILLVCYAVAVGFII